jgi:hypothetical protein
MISYDAGAASYDQLSGRWSRLYIPTLLAQAGIAVGHRVLDVATGTGEAAILAVSRVGAGGKVVGIEAGGGRHGQLYMRLPVPVRRTVRDTVHKRMEPFFVDGLLKMEADVFLAAGER